MNAKLPILDTSRPPEADAVRTARDKPALAEATPSGGACDPAGGGATGATAGTTSGLTDGQAGAIGGGSLAVIGGTIGGLDASGAFDSSDPDSDVR